jgi:hypothetical protein
MTYNFDPDRWYENERTALDERRRSEGWNAADYEAALENLDQRHDAMVRRLDGSYQIPK